MDTVAGTDYTPQQLQDWYSTLSGTDAEMAGMAAEAFAGRGLDPAALAEVLNVAEGGTRFTSEIVQQYAAGTPSYEFGEEGFTRYVQPAPTPAQDLYVAPTPAQDLYVAPPTVEVAAPETPVAREITPLETVRGQLDALLDEEGTYIQAARSRSKEAMAGAGMLSSTMQAEAGEKAAIEAAGPIAKADADTYAAAGLSAQQAGERLIETGYTGMIESARQSEASAQAAAREGLVAGYDVYSAQLQQDFDAKLEAMNISSEEKSEMIDSYTALAQQHMVDLQVISSDPNYKTDTDRANAIANETAEYTAAVTAMASIFGAEVDMTDIIAAAEEASTAAATTAAETEAAAAELPQEYIDYLSSASTDDLQELLDQIGSFVWYEEDWDGVTEDEWRGALEAELANR